MNETLDVAIIGAGTAGLAALREVRKYTQRFVIINDAPWGTHCLRARGLHAIQGTDRSGQCLSSSRNFCGIWY